jgi:hypothetical protein
MVVSVVSSARFVTQGLVKSVWVERGKMRVSVDGKVEEIC